MMLQNNPVQVFRMKLYSQANIRVYGLVRLLNSQMVAIKCTSAQWNARISSLKAILQLLTPTTETTKHQI